MSQVEEAAARLTQARNEIALITERLLDIEVRLVAAKAAEIEQPTKISLRKFTSDLIISDSTRPSRPTSTSVDHPTRCRRTPVVTE